MKKSIQGAVSAAKTKVATAQGTTLIDSTVSQFNQMRESLMRGATSLRNAIQANNDAKGRAQEVYETFVAGKDAENAALSTKVAEAEHYLSLLPAPPVGVTVIGG